MLRDPSGGLSVQSTWHGTQQLTDLGFPVEDLGEERDVLEEWRAVVSQRGKDGCLRMDDGSVFAESFSGRGEDLSHFEGDLPAFEADRSV